MMTKVAPPGPRIASLDQFRGYTVAGMLLVNFLGGYRTIPAILKHHNTYCSYADTIMPQFFLAVGFAYRLAFLRRLDARGPADAYRHALGRSLGLILLGVVLYHLDGEARSWDDLRRLGVAGFVGTAFQRNVFQALVHIGITSIWVLPVIAAGTLPRVGFLIASAAIHVVLSQRSYFTWVWDRPGIDGGPLGFLTWTIPLIVGSLAHDAVMSRGGRQALTRPFGWAAVLMVFGYALSCLGAILDSSSPTWLVEPPFVPPTRPVDLWTMSQRIGSVSYLTFSAGFALAVYALFIIACDLGPLRVGLFRTFGRNALAAYVLHSIVAGAVKPYVPRDAPIEFVLAGLLLYFGLTYLFVRHLEREGIMIRL